MIEKIKQFYSEDTKKRIFITFFVVFFVVGAISQLVM